MINNIIKACKAMGKLEGCLLAHTQPRIDPLKDNISKSLWTEMMREVISQVRKKSGVLLLFFLDLIYFVSRMLKIRISKHTLRMIEKKPCYFSNNIKSSRYLSIFIDLF